MPEDETTQQPGVEATPPAVEEPTGTAEAISPDAQEPEAPTTESLDEITPERFAELQNYEKRYKDIESYKTQLEQERAIRDQEIQSQQQEMERMRRSMAEMIGHQRAQADPIEAARQEYVAAKQDPYNTEREVAAFENYQRLLNEKFKSQAVAEARQTMMVEQLMGKAKSELGLEYTVEQLSEAKERLDPVGLALLRKFQTEGVDGLKGHLDTLAESRNAESQRKAALNQILGSGGTGVMPGGVVGDTVKPKMDYIEWRGMYNAEARKQLLETHEIVNAPEGFHQ